MNSEGSNELLVYREDPFEGEEGISCIRDTQTVWHCKRSHIPSQIATIHDTDTRALVYKTGCTNAEKHHFINMLNVVSEYNGEVLVMQYKAIVNPPSDEVVDEALNGKEVGM